MKTRIILVVTILSPWSLLLSAFGQGSLTPPGFPAPTMKSLDQIEARTPISSAPFLINQPGSYYLTTNMSVGAGAVISIATNDVVLDLNGFYVKGGSGIFVSASVTNLTVRRGCVRNTNTGGHGIGFAGIPNCRVEDVTIIGCGGNAIEVGDNAVVRRCIIDGNNGFGVVATPISGANAVVEDCVIRSNTFGGISLSTAPAVVQNCVVQGNGTNGIALGANSRVKGCQVIQSQNLGVTVGTGSSVSETTAYGNGNFGISAVDNVTIERCTASQNSNNGIATGNNCLIEHCNANQNLATGIASANNCSIESCVATRNSNYGIQAGTTNRLNNCSAAANVSIGFLVNDGSQILNSEASGNGSSGIHVTRYCTVSGCAASGNRNSGIYVGWFGCYILNNIADNNNTALNTGDAGIAVDDSDNRVDGNHLARNGYAGILIITSYINNVVVRNSVAGNGANNYLGTAGNDVGPIGTAATATSPWANISH
jgi:hypothetical protein